MFNPSYLSKLVCVLSFIALIFACKAGAPDDSGGEQEQPNPVKVNSYLNDTGVQFAGNHPRTINIDGCEGKINPEDEWVFGESFTRLDLPGQDCAFGRDKNSAIPEDGHAGFQFEKIGSTGEKLEATASTWSCVADLVSGLMWEVKTDDGGLHDRDDVFSWYNTNSQNNGGAIGNWNRGSESCFGVQTDNPQTFCNTQSFVMRVNNIGLCGYKDWRMPTVFELNNLTNFGRTEPAIDEKYFPNTLWAQYWSDSPHAAGNDVARFVEFRFGVSGKAHKMDQYHVRLVRKYSSR